MKKTTAGEIAKQLRIMADAFDANPELELEPLSIHSPHIGSGDKQRFLNLAKVLPRPIDKHWSDSQLTISWGKAFDDPVAFIANIDRKTVCRLVEPAKPAVYECEPLLTEEELEAVQP